MNEEKKTFAYCGYEIPEDTSKVCLKLLKRLSKKGFVEYSHDDGPSSHLCGELEVIAHDIGLELHAPGNHRLLILDPDRTKNRVVRGASFKKKHCLRKVDRA